MNRNHFLFVIYKVDDFRILNKTREHVDGVIQRFSFEEVEFESVYEAGPVEDKINKEKFSVHVLVDDLRTVSQNWADLIAYDWPIYAIERVGQIPKSVRISELKKDHILKSRFGIEYCLSVLSKQIKLEYYKWSDQSKANTKPKYEIYEDEHFSQNQFISYSLKWACINLARYIKQDPGLSLETSVEIAANEVGLYGERKTLQKISEMAHEISTDEAQEITLRFLEKVIVKLTS